MSVSEYVYTFRLILEGQRTITEIFFVQLDKEK